MSTQITYDSVVYDIPEAGESNWQSLSDFLVVLGGTSKPVSAVFVPGTMTLTTNMAAGSFGTAQYMQVGSWVHVAGTLTVDPTAAGLALTVFKMPAMPITTTFAATTQAAGTFVLAAAAGTAMQCGYIQADSGAGTVSFSFNAGSLASVTGSYTFMYKIV